MMGLLKRTTDLTEFNINIDDLLDVYKGVQEEAGIDTGLVESNLDVDSKGNVIKAAKPDDNKKGCSGCSGNCECKKEDKSSDIYHSDFSSKLGRFADFMSPEIEESEGDGIYVCEYCTTLGYKKEYTPYLCDTCTACDGCNEFESGDCSGCTFSTYRTGRLYSDELRDNCQEVPVDEEHEDLLLKFDADEYDNERRPSNKSFSIKIGRAHV